MRRLFAVVSTVVLAGCSCMHGCDEYPQKAQATAKVPNGFDVFFSGCPEQLYANWQGVTAEDGFDDPLVRRKATPEQREIMQKIADLGMRRHWAVRDGVLRFDGSRGGCSLATKREFADFELWADGRVPSVNGDSWTRFHMIVRDGKVTVWQDGERIVDQMACKDAWDRPLPILPKGQIELRSHGESSEWRNIFIRDL